MQTFKFAKDMAKFTDLRIVAIVGGDPIEAQFDALASRPDIIIATPGRLMHHLREISTFKLKHVQYLVFDEADRLFEMGVSVTLLLQEIATITANLHLFNTLDLLHACIMMHSTVRRATERDCQAMSRRATNTAVLGYAAEAAGAVLACWAQRSAADSLGHGY
jgi:superfamily II DNA/RNA helicase